MRTRLALGIAFLGLSSACGTPPAAPAPTPAPSGKPETFAEVHPDDLAALGGAADAGAAPAADAGPAAPATAPAPTALTKSDPPDECTPIGVEWEKTARPKLKDCYAEGKKKDPNLQGTVKITVDIDIRGKIKSTKIVEKTLPEPVAQCMLKVVKATPIPEQDKCRGKSLTIPMTFPTPK